MTTRINTMRLIGALTIFASGVAWIVTPQMFDLSAAALDILMGVSVSLLGVGVILAVGSTRARLVRMTSSVLSGGSWAALREVARLGSVVASARED